MFPYRPALILSAVGDRCDYLPIWANIHSAFVANGVRPIVINPYPHGPFNVSRIKSFDSIGSNNILDCGLDTGLQATRINERNFFSTCVGWISDVVSFQRQLKGSRYFFSPRISLRRLYQLAPAITYWRELLSAQAVTHVVAVNLVDHPEVALAAIAQRIPITCLQHGDYYFAPDPQFRNPAVFHEGVCSQLIAWNYSAAQYVRNKTDKLPIGVLQGPLWAIKYESGFPQQDENAVVIYESAIIDLTALLDKIRPVLAAHGLTIYIRPHPFKVQIETHQPSGGCSQVTPAWPYPLHRRTPLLAISVASTVSSECAFLGVPVVTLLASRERSCPSCPPVGKFGMDELPKCAEFIDRLLRNRDARHGTLFEQNAYIRKWFAPSDNTPLSSRLAALAMQHAESHFSERRNSTSA